MNVSSLRKTKIIRANHLKQMTVKCHNKEM